MRFDDFCDFLSKIPNRHFKTVLIIGFDGSAALLGHSTGTQMFLTLEARPEGQFFRRVRATKAWAEKNSIASMDFLATHTFAQNPDMEALNYIAALVREKHIHAILATDNRENGLYSHLQRLGLDMVYVDCGSSTITAIKSMSAIALDTEKPLFINGGEILLGLQAILGDPGSNESVGAAISEVLDRFRYQFCWGWSIANTNFSRIWRAKGEVLWALGEYTTAHATYDVLDPKWIECPEDDAEKPTTAVFVETGRRILTGFEPFSARSSSPDARAGSAVTRANLVSRQEDAILVWPPVGPDPTFNMAEQLAIGNVVMIGADGVQTRLRLARRMYGETLERNRCELYDWAEISSLLVRLQFLAKPAKNPTHIFAVFHEMPQQNDDQAASILAEGIHDYLLKRAGVTTGSLILFMPIAWLVVLKSIFARDRQMSALPDKSFPANGVNETLVEAWLSNQLGSGKTIEINPLPTEADIKGLALRMISDIELRPGMVRSDCLHVALDLWAARMHSFLDEEELLDSEISMTNAFMVWKEVMDSFLFVEERFEPYLSFNKIQRLPPSQPAVVEEDIEEDGTNRTDGDGRDDDDDDNFQLGPIRPL